MTIFDDLVSSEPLKFKQNKLKWVSQVLLCDKECLIYKLVTRYGFKDFKTSDELLRGSKRIFDEAVTGIC